MDNSASCMLIFITFDLVVPKPGSVSESTSLVKLKIARPLTSNYVVSISGLGSERPRNLNLLKALSISFCYGQSKGNVWQSLLDCMFHKFHMITFLSECGKGPKRIFAPPAQKSYSLLPCSPNSPKEETLGISSPETEASISLPKTSLKKEEEKAATKNGPSRGQEKKRKAQNNKQAEKKEKVPVILVGSGRISPHTLPLAKARQTVFSRWGNSP